MKRRRLNITLMQMHLAEAKEELETIIEELKDAKREEDIYVNFLHLYHHINTAWNTRHARADYYKTSTYLEFDTNRQFPVNDLQFMTVSDEAEQTDDKTSEDA